MCACGKGADLGAGIKEQLHGVGTGGHGGQVQRAVAGRVARQLQGAVRQQKLLQRRLQKHTRTRISQSQAQL